MSTALAEFASAVGQQHSWTRDAACAGNYGYFDPADDGETANTPRIVEAARTCHTCPVLDACHRSAQTPTQWGTSGLGVRAGLLYNSTRRPSVIPYADPTAPCGTVAGLANHRGRKESPCSVCQPVADNIRPVDRLPAPPEPDAHGTMKRIIQHHQAGEDLCGICQDADTARLEAARPNNLTKYHARQQRLRDGAPVRKSRARRRDTETTEMEVAA